ncbi:MAG: M48 family peptidase [Proteobacteria bacterium]|nr:MAG: M48 family peptidase [Pseudomonadota bacterium]
MIIEARTLTVAGMPVAVVRKGIKNLHLGVYPPDGHVRVAAPLAMSEAAVRVAVVTRLQWIKRQQATFASQARESARQMVSGESHYILGRRLRLRVEPTEGPSRVALRGRGTLMLFVAPDRSEAERLELLRRWYRAQLRDLLAGLVEKWAAKLKVEPTGWRIQRMKTKWGSCNPKNRRLLFNLELAKKPIECIEYIVVHELAHLIERRHDDRFRRVLDRHLPRWEAVRRTLNAGALGDYGGIRA